MAHDIFRNQFGSSVEPTFTSVRTDIDLATVLDLEGAAGVGSGDGFRQAAVESFLRVRKADNLGLADFGVRERAGAADSADEGQAPTLGLGGQRLTPFEYSFRAGGESAGADASVTALATALGTVEEAYLSIASDAVAAARAVVAEIAQNRLGFGTGAQEDRGGREQSRAEAERPDDEIVPAPDHKQLRKGATKDEVETSAVAAALLEEDAPVADQRATAVAAFVLPAAVPAEAGAMVGVTFQSGRHVFSIDDIIGEFDGTTYADDDNIIDMSDGAETYTDKALNELYPIDSEFGFLVQDFLGAIQKSRDPADPGYDPDYTEGWAANILNDTGEVSGLALRNAMTDTFKSGQPLGTWAAGLGGNSVKASTENYSVMAALLSDQAYAEDPNAIYALDNDLRILALDPETLAPGVLNGLYVDELTTALETSIAAMSDPAALLPDLDFNRDGIFDTYAVGTVIQSVDGVDTEVAAVDLGGDGSWDVIDSGLNGFGTANVVDLLNPNESTVTYDIAVGDDYSVTLKDDGKLLYRWGTMVKRPNDIRMDVKLDIPDEWKEDIGEVNGGLGYLVTKAELVITHNITNNPNDQVRPEDYENEDAIGRKPAYYIVVDPDDPENELWVSPRDAYGGDGSFLPSYFKLTDTGEVDMAAGGVAVYFPPDPDTGVSVLAGYRNTDADGNLVGTVLRDQSLVTLNESADLEFESSDIIGGFTNAWYTSMDRDPFEWSYDKYIDDPFRQDFVGFANREEAEVAGFTEEQLVSGPRWRLIANKFGQNIPGVEIPLEDNSQPPFQHDNIGYPTGETVVTTLNLLDWAGTSPLEFSGGWTLIDPHRLDEDRDGVIDEGWSLVNGVFGGGDDVPEGPVFSAVSPNGQSLTPDFFDVSFYLKGDRQDSAKLFDVQLIVEYETDPSLVEVFDYGDAPDDEAAHYQYGADGTEDAARAQILAGFYLGAPVDGETVTEPDLDAEFAPLTDAYALGDDSANIDDEGNAISFLTPLLKGGEAWIDVTASIAAAGLTQGYLTGWLDLDGSGTWDEDERVLTSVALTDGSNLLSFDVPDYVIGDLEDDQVFARFILSDSDMGVAAYRGDADASFHGEVEDYLINLTDATDDMSRRDGLNWSVGLSDGTFFKIENYGNTQTADWQTAVVGDFDGDGVDDIAGYAGGDWLAGISTYLFDPAAYDPADPDLNWSFDFRMIDNTAQAPVGDVFGLDFNGDGTDEVVYRNVFGRIVALSHDDSFPAEGKLVFMKESTHRDVLKGDFDGDGAEELAGLKISTGGLVDNWWVVDYDTDTETVGKSIWGGAWQPADYDFVVGDYNGDGMDDIAGRNDAGQWIVGLSEGDGFTVGKSWTRFGAGELVGSGDVNGDGVDDILLFNHATGRIHVGLADPDNEKFEFGVWGRLKSLPTWDNLSVGDFNGDGLSDFAARRLDTGRWVVMETDGEGLVKDFYGAWNTATDWQNVMVGNFDAMPSIVDAAPVDPLADDDGNGQGSGAGDGTGDGSGDHGGGTHGGVVPTPPDELLNTDPTAYRVSHVFSTDDITGGFDGVTQGEVGGIIDFGATPMMTKDGDNLYPIDSEFGFYVTDFVGAEDKVRDGVFAEGWAGDLVAEDGTQLGLLVADAATDRLQTPNLLGTWLVGMGGSAVKASTEHYTVMQAILSDQAHPDDPDALIPLDDDLRLIDYEVGPDGHVLVDIDGYAIGGAMHDGYVYEFLQALGAAGSGDPLPVLDFDRDGIDDAYTAYVGNMEFDGVNRSVAMVDLGNDGSVDYYDRGLNGFGTFGLADVLEPNESSVVQDIAYSDDYSVTLKDDGKLLYRWGNLIKRPNDVRVSAELDLPDEWTEEEGGLKKLFHVTNAELIVHHTVTNNPNDQVRPEDFENEAAIGRLPTYDEVIDPNTGRIQWFSSFDVYAGDGTLYEAGTLLRDTDLIDTLDGSRLAAIGATSKDLDMGFTNAWYTTMDREPFEAVLTSDGTEYVLGPRWRLQPDKYGQDLPSVVIPQDPSLPPPISNGEEKYESGVDTTTVLNLLDWEGVSPLALSAGWQIGSGEVSDNGLEMTDNFDVALYIKGDKKPVTIYDTELVLSYEEVAIHDVGAAVVGSAGDDFLVGQGDNVFVGGAGADVFVLGYGPAGIGVNSVADFDLGEEDALGFIGYGLDRDNYNIHLTQNVTTGGDLEVSLDGTYFATLLNFDMLLEADNFYFA